MLENISCKNRKSQEKSLTLKEPLNGVNQFNDNDFQALIQSNNDSSKDLINRSKRMKWMPNPTICSELNEQNFNPITKRLCSLVNTKTPNKSLKSSFSFTNLTNNNSNQAETINFMHPLKNSYLKHDSNNDLIATDSSHCKLRGFLKQIASDKSGIAYDIDTNMSRSTKNLTINKITNVIKEADNNSNFKRVTGKLSYQFKEKICSNNSINNISNKHTDNLTYIKTRSEREKLVNSCSPKNEKPKINCSNSNRMINNHLDKSVSRISQFSPTKSIDCSSNSSDINNTLNQIKTYSSDDKLSLDQEYVSKRDSINKLSYLFNKFARNHNKTKLNNFNKTNVNPLRSYNSQKDLDNSIEQTHRNFDNKSINTFDNCKITSKDRQDSAMSELPINHKNYSGYSDWNRENSPKYFCENTNRGKSKFSKKLFRIFSQSNYSKDSKKFKLLQSSLNTVENISFDNLINLITILSVELILSSLKNKSRNDASKPTDKGDVEQIKRRTNSFKSTESKKNFTESTKFPDNLNKSKTSLVSAATQKKLNISFDLNGRAIVNRNPSESASLKLHFRNNCLPGSLNNLHHNSKMSSGLRNKNSSTLSIPTRFSSEFHNRIHQPKVLNVFPHNGDIHKSTTQLEKKITQIIPRQSSNTTRVRTLSRGDGKNSTENITNSLSTSTKPKPKPKPKPVPVRSKIRPNSACLSEAKRQIPITQSRLEINDEGNYKMSVPIKTCLDFHQLDEIFSLKEELYNSCNNTLLYIRSKNTTTSTKSSKHSSSKNCIDSWVLYVESPNSETLNKSLKKVSAKFPEWNVKTKVDNLSNTQNNSRIF